MHSLFMIRPKWHGTFRRIVRKDDGTPTKKVFVFAPGVPVEVAPRYMAAIKRDIDKAVLVPVTVDKKGRPHVIRDPEPERKAETNGQPDVEAGHGE